MGLPLASGEGQVFIFVNYFLTIFFFKRGWGKENRDKTDASSPLISLPADKQAAR